MDATNAAPPRFQSSPDCRLRPYIPALVCLITEVAEENGKNQLRTTHMLAFRIGSVDAQKHLRRTLRGTQRLRARSQDTGIAAYARFLFGDLLLQALNARAQELHELGHPHTHLGRVTVHVEARVVRVHEHEQEELLEFQVSITRPKGQRVVPFILLL